MLSVNIVISSPMRNVTIPVAGRPHNISSLKPQMAIRSDHLVVYLISDQGYYTFLYRYAKHTTAKTKEKKNEQTRAWVSSKRQKGKLYATLLCSSPCISWLSQARILRETSTKSLGMLTHLLTALFPSSHCLLLLTVSFSGQLSQADCSLLPSFVNWLSLSSLGPSSPPPLLVSREISPSVLCVGFAPKQTKRSSEWRQRKQKPMQRIVSQQIIGNLVEFEFTMNVMH